MKTIVINTSKEAVKTKLDVLFKAPCNLNNLIWLEPNLEDINEIPLVIKQSLIDNSDIVDKDYNLIVLVDLYQLPYGNNAGYTEIYKPLIARYIGTNVICELYSKQGLIPASASIYFAESSTMGSWQEVTAFDAKNATEQQQLANSKIIEKENARQAALASGNISDDLIDQYEVELPGTKQAQRSKRQKFIMNLLDWAEDMTFQDVSWKLPISADKQAILDLAPLFEMEITSMSCRKEGCPIIDEAILTIETVVSQIDKETDGYFVSALPDSADIPFEINCRTIKFDRDNEQNFIEGFFNVFANIFRCVQANDVALDTKIYSSDEIKQILISALKKYSHFSNENNIALEFEPIKTIFDKRDKIFEKRNDDANVSAGVKDSIKYAENLISKESPKSENDEHSEGQYEIDRRFYDLVAEIFANYDPKVIEKQNAEIVKDCFEGLWTWRDKQTREDFKNTVDAFLETQTGNYNSKVRENLTFVDTECEKEYYEIFNEITDAEYHLCANKNILLDVKNLIFEYGRLMRKGKWYLMSFIGAIVTIFITVFPYVYIEYNSGNSGLPFYAAALLYVALFAFLYGVASSIYIYKIHKRKNVLVTELEELKQQSEKDRIESIAMLYKYYKETVVKAENFSLLLHEIFRRDRENAKKGVKRNNHIKHLELLIGEVKRFMTMLKYDCNDSACKVTSEDINDYSSKNLCLNAEESFHSEDNRRIYSIFTEDENQEKGE